jgi:hypothetical protein
MNRKYFGMTSEKVKKINSKSKVRSSLRRRRKRAELLKTLQPEIDKISQVETLAEEVRLRSEYQELLKKT